MAFDGIMMRALCNEINCMLAGYRVDKVVQPERDEIVLQFRSRRLLISANPSAPRICLTEQHKENPSVAPNFCMLLRKHLLSAKLLRARQPGLERVMMLEFECKTELFETVTETLIIEVMGHCSNIIFVDCENRICGAVRQTDLTAEERRILPGIPYQLPPAQDKTDITIQNFSFDLLEGTGRLDKQLSAHLLGFSALVAREIAYRCTGQTDTDISVMTFAQKQACCDAVQALAKKINTDEFCPILLVSHKPTEYYCFDICQYSGAVEKQYPKSCSQAVEAFYREKAEGEYLRRISADIMKTLSTLIARISRKIEAQRGELRECARADIYKLYADILTSNLYCLHGGDKEVTLMNYFSDEPEPCTIPLDPQLSPVKNAQRYYKLYRKAQTARQVLQQQIPAGIEELTYLNGVADFIQRATSPTEVSQIRTELAAQGYLRAGKATKQKKEPAYTFAQFVSDDGFTILAGKNNLQNDALTLKMAEKQDIWFHIKGYAGSHVVVFCAGKIPPDKTLTQAAIIAATMGKKGLSGKVEVDYTEIKNVKKPNGAKPGMVTYNTYKTAVVEPDEQLIHELIVKKIKFENSKTEKNEEKRRKYEDWY